MNADTSVIEIKTAKSAPMMSVLDAVALTVKRHQSQHQDSNMDEFRRAGSEFRVIKEDDIYECLACSKMYTAEAMYVHEKVCTEIPTFLKRREEEQAT